MVATNLTSIFLTLILAFSTSRCYQYDCSRTEYNKCVKIADPLVRDMHLVFPDNLQDIDAVCRTWNSFIECLQVYTDRCFTADQRKQFNNAVRNPIDSVHQMCLRSEYQREYLVHAPCIKSTITDATRCAHQYNLLVDQVARGDDISRATLCCSHDRFKKCIETETKNLCDGGKLGGPASRFSTQIVEKALSFLQDECFNYIPNSGDCSNVRPNKATSPTDSAVSPASGEVYPWSTIQESAGRERPSKLPSVKATSAWLPSSTFYQPASDSSSTISEILGARTRPSSYGRSSGWTDYASPNTQVGLNTMSSDSVSSPKPDWATISTWHVPKHQPSSLSTSSSNDGTPSKGFSLNGKTEFEISSTQTWFPAAGDQLENEVDEPNQQGLVKPKNNARVLQTNRILSIIVLFLAIC